jgi:glycosyltransferase involved in cell wall biosynthesis
VRGLDKSRFRPIVTPLYPAGEVSADFYAVPGVEIVELYRMSKLDPSPLWKIGRLLRERQVDIIQPFLTPSTFFGLLPALAVGTPIKIVTERCGVRVERQVGNKIYRYLEDRLTRWADIVVPNSRAGLIDVMRRGVPADKIQVIYNGVSPERVMPDRQAAAAIRQRLRTPADGRVVGILASLTPAKDHANLLQAMASLAPAWPGLRLAIIGEGYLRGELEERTAELGLAERVIFFGRQARVADYLAACDILVSSSRDNEGTSNSILEAMGQGIAVVATDIGGNSELVESEINGLLVPPADHRLLATAIERLLAEPALRSRLARRGQQVFDERFALSRMVGDYEGLYERLLAAKRRPAGLSAGLSSGHRAE